MNKQWKYLEREVLKTALTKKHSLAWVQERLPTRTERAIRRETRRIAKIIGIEGNGWWNRLPGAPQKKIKLQNLATKAEPIPGAHSDWHKRELEILRAYYPLWGADCVLRELLKEGFFRSIDEICAKVLP